MPWEHHPARGVLRWRVHLRATPDIVYRFLATDEGRSSFWAERTEETDEGIVWELPDGGIGPSRVLERAEGVRFVCEYREGAVVEFDLESDGREGTDLTVTELGVSESASALEGAGWVSVLLNLKSVVEFGNDLRNHDGDRSWDRGFVDS
jgi:uncharacterized protein YndB with AHSA1/START domain